MCPPVSRDHPRTRGSTSSKPCPSRARDYRGGQRAAQVQAAVADRLIEEIAQGCTEEAGSG